jgi:radical SAM protein with 4Fe4S-binding SPASM domain
MTTIYNPLSDNPKWRYSDENNKPKTKIHPRTTEQKASAKLFAKALMKEMSQEEIALLLWEVECEVCAYHKYCAGRCSHKHCADGLKETYLARYKK